MATEYELKFRGKTFATVKSDKELSPSEAMKEIINGLLRYMAEKHSEDDEFAKMIVKPE